MNDSLKQDGLPEPRFRSGVKVLFSFALRIQQGFFSIALPRFGAVGVSTDTRWTFRRFGAVSPSSRF